MTGIQLDLLDQSFFVCDLCVKVFGVFFAEREGFAIATYAVFIDLYKKSAFTD